jgi:hypothetical protein
MGLSHSHDQSYKFSRLIQVKLCHFFNFLSIMLSQSDNPGHEFG